MAEIDSRIALGIQPVQINDPLEQYGKGLQLKALLDSSQLNQLKYQQAQKDIALDDGINNAYKNAYGADGTLDRQKLYSGVAQAGGGSKLPGIQKGFAEADKLGSESQLAKFKVAKEKTERLGSLAGTALQILATGNINQVPSVYGEAVRQGLMTPEEAQQEMGQLNWSDPNAIANHFKNVQLQSVDALKQIELNTPKFEKVNTGKQTVFVDTNGRTNPNPQSLRMTTTPDADQSASVSIRGQNMTDARGREANNIQRQASRTEVVQTPEGYALVDKGTGQARPAMLPNGERALPKDSPLYKAKDQYQASVQTIQDAKKLLPGATGSGAGRLLDSGAAFFGKSTAGAEANDQLKVLAGRLTSAVPRFEGPQSDKDVQLYKEMAGDIGNENIPYQRRLKALDAVEKLLDREAKRKGYEKPGLNQVQPFKFMGFE